ncbi:MAG: hypothetical protein ABW203_08055, partial [Novosphingobium sp.]
TLVLYRVHPEAQVSEQNLAKRLIDRAHLWSILQGHMDARGDADAATRRLFRLKKYDVAHEVRPLDPGRAEALAVDVGGFERALRPARHFARRVQGKLRVMRHGNSYAWPFAAAPLTPAQRERIAALGYRLPGPAG